MLKKHVAFGEKRHEAKSSLLIYSKRTYDNYRLVITRASQFMQDHELRGLIDMNAKRWRVFLEHRAPRLTPQGLNQERSVLSRFVPSLRDVPSPNLVGQKKPTARSTKPRAYTNNEINLTVPELSPKDQLVAVLIANTGVRVSDVIAIGRPDEQPPSKHRMNDWKPERFEGIGPSREYTFVTKGGLVHPAWVPQHLVPAIEACRLPYPVETTDHRGNPVTRYYNLPGGTEYGRRFSKTSHAVLGFSHGAHGLRHYFANRRVAYHQDQGRTYKQARLIVSQEMGHFRDKITKTYLR